jgi:3-carboxy-cis,cis-muconate cycloisomerase
VPTTLFTTDPMRAFFDDRARIQRMLDVEAALARAEARVGVIPESAAPAIARCCRAELYDIDAFTRAVRNAGNLAIPLVAALTKKVGEEDAAARGYVHWGATSQDIIDTGLVLQLRDAFALIERDVARLDAALAAQVDRHRLTVMPGRTWLQQGLPTTLGLKLAGVLSALRRDRARLAALAPRLCVLQFGGATGTLASLGAQGPAVAQALADELALAVAETPWHTQRDRLCEAATTLGILTATLGKLARDLALLAQTEVGEAFEPAAPGRGGSSTMPQKRNPVGASFALAAAVRVPPLVGAMLAAAVQEHERGLGNWPTEWDTLPEIVMLTAGALDAMAETVDGLVVDAARMRANLDTSKGQVLAEAVQMALAPALGRDVAHKLVGDAAKRATREGRHLKDLLESDSAVRAVLDEPALARLFDPVNYLGATGAFIERVLATH